MTPEEHSAATRRGLAAAKARGVKLGNPRLTPGDAACARQARSARSKKALHYAREVAVHVEAARQDGCTTLGELARALTAHGIATPADCTTWSVTMVQRVIQRATGGIALDALRENGIDIAATAPTAAACAAALAVLRELGIEI